MPGRFQLRYAPFATSCIVGLAAAHENLLGGLPSRMVILRDIDHMISQCKHPVPACARRFLGFTKGTETARLSIGIGNNRALTADYQSEN